MPGQPGWKLRSRSQSENQTMRYPTIMAPTTMVVTARVVSSPSTTPSSNPTRGQVYRGVLFMHRSVACWLGLRGARHLWWRGTGSSGRP